jgi:glycosyltransferase involved in cell wall biosynthesis
MFSYYFPPQYSGAALQAISLAKKLRERGVTTTFVTVNHDGLPETDRMEGFTVHRVLEGTGKFGELLLWKNMWRLINEQKTEIDIIHAHGAYLRNSFVGPLSKMLGKKSLIKVSLADNDLHGLGVGKSGWLHKRFISMAVKYISISGEISNELLRYGFPRGKIEEIPNGVDTARYYPVSPEEKILLRRKVGLPGNDLMLLYVGVVDFRKNIKWLLDMWDELNSSYPGFLAVVGPVSREDKDGKEYNSLRGYEEKLKNKLFFIPYSDQIENFYQMADIFVLPSVNEGMPNVVLEAMSSGVPCLANKVSGTEDIIDGENSLLFDIREPESFTRGLNTLRDTSFREEMSKIARQFIIKNYSIDIVADKYIALYKKMLEI